MPGTQSHVPSLDGSREGFLRRAFLNPTGSDAAELAYNPELAPPLFNVIASDPVATFVDNYGLFSNPFLSVESSQTNTNLIDQGLHYGMQTANVVSLVDLPVQGWNLARLGLNGLRAVRGAEAGKNALEGAQALRGTGAFLKGAEGGEGLGRLVNRPIAVSQRGLNTVEQHLQRFGQYEPNAAMVERLRGALQSGERITGADASFYMHEMSEATMMGRGVPYAAAHQAALDRFLVSPYSVYHPEVITANPQLFNQNWKDFWGLK